jgi:hypothetical protein
VVFSLRHASAIQHLLVHGTEQDAKNTYASKGLFISSFICFYLVAVKLYALHQFESIE